MTPDSELGAAITALLLAAEALHTAADLLSDHNADLFADAGGIGRPPKDRRVEALYGFAAGLDAAIEEVGEIREELDF